MPGKRQPRLTKKTNFGTLRNQDRQNDMQRFIKDLFCIKAEIICELFSKDTLVGFLSPDKRQNKALADAAVALLKNEKMRGMLLEVETDNVFNADEEAVKTLNGVKTLGDLINAALPVVSQQPLLLPLYRAMIEAVCVSLPQARSFENVLEKVFNDISKDLNEPEPPRQPDPQLQLAQEKLNLEREKNQLKSRELDIKEFSEKAKVEQTDKEMKLQSGFKIQEIADERKKTNAIVGERKPVVITQKVPLPLRPKKVDNNVTTGYVKAFE